MVHADLFLGVVSHPASRFTHNQGNEGFPARLGAELSRQGLAVDFIVETRNLFEVGTDDLTTATVQESLSAQLDLDMAWDRYVNGGGPLSVKQRLRHLLLVAARQWRRIQRPPAASMRRLLNIELAHVSLLQRGVISGAPWIVILEDDGDCTDIVDCATGLASVLVDAPDSVAYINLSESFDLASLHIASVLHPSDVQWRGSIDRTIMSAERPVTNTVCAIAYRREFAERLLAEYEDQGSFPVVPIDWKLNRAIMSMVARGELDRGSCWWIHPGPIKQMSMHSSARAGEVS